MTNVNIITFYFGRARETADEHNLVSTTEFADFLEEHVDTVFDGYTIIEGGGVYKRAYEPTYMLKIVDIDRKGTPKVLKKIAEAYKKEFRQECVLCTSEPRSGYVMI